MTRGEVLGLPVLAQEDGRRVGLVADVLCNRAADRVIGLLLRGSVRGGRRVVPFEEVAAVGPAAVMLRRPVVIGPARGPALRALRAAHGRLTGMAVLTADGRDLGIVSDFDFDERSGGIRGYVLSGGVVHDLIRGEGFLAAGEPLTRGESALIVQRDAAGTETRPPG